MGCGDSKATDDPSARQTINQQTTEIKSTERMIVVPNTEHIDYQAYSLEWRRVNNKIAPTVPDFTLNFKSNTDLEDHEVVKMNLSDLSFADAFDLEFRAKGEGHTFWWRSTEYTTNLLNVVRKPEGFKTTDPYIERTPIPVAKEVTPTEGG